MRLSVLNPMSKLEWFSDVYSTEFAAQVKSQLLQAVSTLIFLSHVSTKNLSSLGLFIHLCTHLLKPPVSQLQTL
jgi:hypothetical protein